MSVVKGYKIALRCGFTIDASLFKLMYLPNQVLSLSSPHTVFPPFLFADAQAHVKMLRAAQGFHPTAN